MRSTISAYWVALFCLVMLGVLVAAATVAARVGPASEGLAISLVGPAFRFTERSGQPFGSDDLAGKVWIADFVFTACAGPCPLMTQRMADLQAEFAADPNVLFVSFSVDPQRDTPAVLRQYADAFGAGPRWFFLTGERDEIYRTCTSGFLLTVADQRQRAGRPIDDTLADEAASRPVDSAAFEHMILHDVRFVLVDQRGFIRGFYDSTDPPRLEALEREAAALARDLRVPPAVAPLPAVNATLNGACTLLLFMAYVAIRARNTPLHATLMLAATVTSALFLASYVTYHALAGATRFAAGGPVKYVYYVILLTHVVLAAAIVPLVLVTLIRALTRRFDHHRRIARFTLPLWLYVSVTGVVIYVMLYHAYPPPGLRL